MTDPETGYGNILHRGKQDGEYAGHPPIMKLRYKYKYPLSTMAMAYLNKYTWEPKYFLTTIAGVEQVDADKLVYLRRHDSLLFPDPTYERVTIDRAEKTMRAETLSKNSDGTESLAQLHKFYEDAQQNVLNEFHVFQGADKSTKIDLYRQGIGHTIQAIKFAEFEA